MPNTSKKSTELQTVPVQPTMMTQLASCTDSRAFNNALAKAEQTLTIKQSIETAPLIAHQGEKKKAIKEIIRIIEFFLTVTGQQMETFQIIIMAGDLYEKFKTDTLEDVVLMFKMARQGDFGKVYKFDTFTVMEWANAYLMRKSEEREKLLRSAKLKPKEEPKGKYFHELPAELQEKFKRIRNPTTQKFLTPKITDYLTHQKHRDQIAKAIKNDENDTLNQ
ncbi:hypothetical protein JZ949_09950 [Riemerella anatipestifer]|uniref:Uncharacterized protein n=1 Tax=Riemerella anatipestifer TaxID=34085 RepID=A0AAP6HFE6_RIEAN|nr:hypothetical protein [Riemerella anatipestifer]MBT0527109.1 hypothetical protein [Riemerella anatipestifer]MDR7817099.1 hypothetical protein [Riemerella anatipestifer]MDR7849668.1 hypothetical protein [Riemerella anatipestifer]MDR7880338.1 hypothetical protein [Riemerella anatipestifer]MDY3501725.1 hypothetical protein [Riemerella anatipestifer]